MRRWLKDNWYIFPIAVFVGLLNGFTDLSDGKKIIYIFVFSIIFFIIVILIEKKFIKKLMERRKKNIEFRKEFKNKTGVDLNEFDDNVGGGQ